MLFVFISVKFIPVQASLQALWRYGLNAQELPFWGFPGAGMHSFWLSANHVSSDIIQ